MKRTCLLLSLTISVYCSKAQNSFPSPTGNINVTSSGGSFNNTFSLTGTGANTFSIYPYIDGNTYLQHDGKIIFSPLSNVTPRLVIAPNGGIGIGVLSPGGNLHVSSPSGNTTTSFRIDANGAPNWGYYDMKRLDNLDGVGHIIFSEGYGAGDITWTANGGQNTGMKLAYGGYGSNAVLNLYNTANASKVQFNTNGDSYFSGGNVGIGIIAPGALLHLNGPLDGNSSLTIGTSNTAGNIAVPLGSSTGGYNIDFHGFRDVLADQIGARIRAERINNYMPNNALVQSMDLTFYTSDGWDQNNLTEKLRIKSTGDVGIGTNNPNGYKLAVNGHIRATEIKVETGWSDYVFYKNYRLRPLTEVSAYIDQNGHLPDVPSAAEVKKNGVNVGETESLLLRKIEELTLYLIEKDSKEKEQAAQISNQQIRLKALEGRLKALEDNK